MRVKKHDQPLVRGQGSASIIRIYGKHLPAKIVFVVVARHKAEKISPTDNTSGQMNPFAQRMEGDTLMQQEKSLFYGIDALLHREFPFYHFP